MVVVTRAGMRAMIDSGPGSSKDDTRNRGVGIPEETSDSSSEEWKIYSQEKRLKGKKKEKPFTDSLKAAISFLEMDQEKRMCFFVSKVSETFCKKCGTKGKWVRGKQDPKSGSWIWGCGTLTGKQGCSRTITQGFLFANAIGVTDFKEYKERLPKEAYRLIANLDIRPIQDRSREAKRPLVRGGEELPEGLETNTKRQETQGDPESLCDNVVSWANSVRALMDAAINIAKQATTLEEARAAFEILEKAKVFLNRADALAELERSRLMNLEVTAQARQRSYAQIASRGGPPLMRTTHPGRITAEQIEAKSQDAEERRKMACAALSWKKKAPIGKRMLKEGEELKEGPLKDNVEAMEFVYVEGISRMRYSEVRSILKVAGVDTRMVKDISFVGGRVCSFLTEKAYKLELVRALAFEGSPLKTLDTFDPMSGENLKRKPTPAQMTSPMDLFIRRAASAVANNRRLEIATKYQYQLPAEYREKLRLEVQKILDTRNKSRRPKQVLPAATVPTVVGDSTSDTEAMETDT